jgi:LPXTG-motif cell wall-anchored protein
MHRRLVRSLATMMGAAALVVAPIALIAPAAQADHVLTPDSFLPGEPEYNDEDNWAAQLEEDGFVNVVCIKVEGEELTDPYLIPELEDEDRAYVLAVVKAGNTAKANEIYEEPEAGHYLSHATSENSHIILCSAELEDDTSTPTPTPTKPTGPVVETDRVADTGSTTALGVFAAGAMIVGAGALFLSRRRQGAHR